MASEGRISRRDLLCTVARGAAAAALVSTSRIALAAPTSPEWEPMVAAARKEGKVSVNTFTGQGYARVLKLFSQTYPEIKLEHTNLEPVEFSPRVIQERKASVYTWDVATMPMSTALQVLKPAGVWDPVRPVIVAPEAKNNANWRGGFDAGFLDHDRNLAYAFTLVRAPGVFVNVDQVKEGELRSVKDLLAPKWKGRIAISDPRTIGSTFWPLTAARLRLGPGAADQQPLRGRRARRSAGGRAAGAHALADRRRGAASRADQDPGHRPAADQIGSDAASILVPPRRNDDRSATNRRTTHAR